MKSQSATSHFRLRTAMAATAPSVLSSLLFAFPSSAQAGPASCELLKDPQVMSMISGAGEMALRALCGELGAPAGMAAARGSAVEVQPACAEEEGTNDVLVNRRADDTAGTFTQSEPSVARYADTLVAGFNDSGLLATTGNVTGYARSTDGGKTWTDIGVPAVPLNNVQLVQGDPVLKMDRRPSSRVRTYFANLGVAVSPPGLSIIAVHRSDNFGKSWLHAANASPLAAANDTQDKEWMAVDTRRSTGPGAGNVYVCWTRFGGAGGIQISRSTDGGATFTQLASNVSGNANKVQGCAVDVDPRDGRVYVVWSDFIANEIRMRISEDFGVSFGQEFAVGSLLPKSETVAQCGPIVRPVFLDSEPGAENRAIRSQPFPSLAVNPTNGHVYVTWHRGAVNNPDIAFARSTTGDAGTYLTTDIIRQGAQFFPSVAVNRKGEVALMYYSTENSPTNRMIDTYAVKSDDGVNFHEPRRLTEVSFDRAQTNPQADPALRRCYMGDYNTVAAAAPGHKSAEFNYIWGDNRLQRSVGGTLVPDPDVRFESDDSESGD